MTLRRFPTPLIWLLLGAALLLRAAVPAGWMPAAGQEGVRIAICTSDGSEFLTLGANGQLHKDAPEPAVPSEECPYALAASMAANATPAGFLPTPTAASLTPPGFPDWAKFALAPDIEQRPPATGPPRLA